MAKQRKKGKTNVRKRQAAGILVLLMAAVILVSLVTHHHLDDQRITGQIDRHLNPFELQYRNQAGMLGGYLSFVLVLLLGWLAYFVPFGLLAMALRLVSPDRFTGYRHYVLLLFIMALMTTMIYNVHLVVFPGLAGDSGCSGGLTATHLTIGSVKLVGEIGSYISLIGMELILVLLFTSFGPVVVGKLHFPAAGVIRDRSLSIFGKLKSLADFNRLAGLFSRNGDIDDENEQPPESQSPELREAKTESSQSEDDSPAESPVRRTKRQTIPDKLAGPLQIDSADYSYPGIDLLESDSHSAVAVSSEELALTARQLETTLETFGVVVDGNIDKFPGPVITRYEFKPGTGIKVNRITNLSEDLALALKAKRIRIVAPIPGKAAVGVEIPNQQAQIVYLKDVLSSKVFAQASLRLPLALGKTTSGKPMVADLSKLPHLLVAGATGSGKSVCLNCIITSLLYRLHPHQVRFILIDPKMLELTVYKSIPHLGRPVVTSPRRAEKVLADVVVEMEGRYRKLAEASVRNIEDYNSRQTELQKQLPYIVVMVDELADLLMSANSSRTELLITRLAQMARAVGIHLILATQRPSVDVITGLIKANFPARIAFQVSSKVDSRTIIDANGAEKLLGNGDMLYLQPGQPEPVRVHGAFVSNRETDAIVKFIKEQGMQMPSLENISQARGEVKETEIDFGDPLFREACEVVVRHKQGSVSLLQRRLGIGYQRAARLIDKLEQAGIVSTFDGSKAREVLVDKAYIETLFSTSGSASATEGSQN
ncbi:MAG: DNA translocase FtsK 4TM domain-containing protein [bacterium]